MHSVDTWPKLRYSEVRSSLPRLADVWEQFGLVLENVAAITLYPVEYTESKDIPKSAATSMLTSVDPRALWKLRGGTGERKVTFASWN